MTKWISLGIEYPPIFKKVLVTDGTNLAIYSLRLRDGFKFWYSHDKKKLKGNVYHWMYIPEPPK